jgi:hypothetical protein
LAISLLFHCGFVWLLFVRLPAANRDRGDSFSKGCFNSVPLSGSTLRLQFRSSMLDVLLVFHADGKTRVGTPARGDAASIFGGTSQTAHQTSAVRVLLSEGCPKEVLLPIVRGEGRCQA